MMNKKIVKAINNLIESRKIIETTKIVLDKKFVFGITETGNIYLSKISGETIILNENRTRILYKWLKKLLEEK